MSCCGTHCSNVCQSKQLAVSVKQLTPRNKQEKIQKETTFLKVGNRFPSVSLVVFWHESVCEWGTIWSNRSWFGLWANNILGQHKKSISSWFWLQSLARNARHSVRSLRSWLSHYKTVLAPSHSGAGYMFKIPLAQCFMTTPRFTIVSVSVPNWICLTLRVERTSKKSCTRLWQCIIKKWSY